MIFRIFHPIIKFATAQFFRKIVVSGAPRVEDEPVLIVANHPNVMLDALLILTAFKRPIWFLAKASIFRGAIITRLLDLFHFVPIYRRQDNPEEVIKNENTFQLAAEKLRNGSAILIFPEGKSMASRQLLPVKTGAARIALQTESETDFKAGLKIQPVGLTYGDFFRLQSTVTITVGDPITVADYSEEFQQNPVAAVKTLSKEIEQRLKNATAEVSESDHTQIVGKISKLYQSKGYGNDDRERIKVVAEEVSRLAPLHPDKVEQIEKRIDQYLHLSSSLKLDGSKGLRLEYNKPLLYFSAPFIIVGTMLHIPIYRFVARLTKKKAAHRSQIASWGISLSFFSIPPLVSTNQLISLLVDQLYRYRHCCIFYNPPLRLPNQLLHPPPMLIHLLSPLARPQNPSRCPRRNPRRPNRRTRDLPPKHTPNYCEVVLRGLVICKAS